MEEKMSEKLHGSFKILLFVTMDNAKVLFCFHFELLNLMMSAGCLITTSIKKCTV
jgi:hypothetical protein